MYLENTFASTLMSTKSSLIVTLAIVQLLVLLWFGNEHIFEQSDVYEESIIEEDKTIALWSPEALMKRNESISMLLFPKEDWPSYSTENRGVCPVNLKFYIADLPEEVSTEVEEFVKDLLKSGKDVRSEVSMEFALKQLLETSPCRTYNTSESDLHVVPYMHSADCDYKYDPTKGSTGCRQVNTHRINMVRSSVPSYIPINRQVFISMGLESSTRDHLRFYNGGRAAKIPRPIKVKLTTGDGQHHGIFAMPTLNLLPKYQPSIVSRRDEHWWTRPRKFAFIATYGHLNEYMSPYAKQPRCFRTHFFNYLNQKYSESSDFAGTGLPYLAEYTERSDVNERKEKGYQYEESTLCPILPGDGACSNRFYDVILGGCIPVVLEWQLNYWKGINGQVVQGEGKTSWYVPEHIYPCAPDEDQEPHYNPRLSIVNTYPFISSLSTYNDLDTNTTSRWAIDYRSFVITAPGNTANQSDMTALFDAMISALKDPEDLKRRQLNLMKYATRLTVGLGLDAHKYDDAFAGALKLLELYKDSL